MTPAVLNSRPRPIFAAHLLRADNLLNAAAAAVLVVAIIAQTASVAQSARLYAASVWASIEPVAAPVLSPILARF